MKKRKAVRQSNRIPVPLILIGIGAILIVGVLAYQAIRAAQQTAISAQGGPAAQEIPVENIKRVTLANSKAAFDDKSAVFLDVRAPETYAIGHIPGSLNIPLAELESRVGELDPNQWIITYCT